MSFLQKSSVLSKSQKMENRQFWLFRKNPKSVKNATMSKMQQCQKCNNVKKSTFTKNGFFDSFPKSVKNATMSKNQHSPKSGFFGILGKKCQKCNNVKKSTFTKNGFFWHFRQKSKKCQNSDRAKKWKKRKNGKFLLFWPWQAVWFFTVAPKNGQIWFFQQNQLFNLFYLLFFS